MRGGKGKNGLLPNSLRIISSCLKTVSSNAGSVASTVRSAGASVAASIAVPADAEKDQVLWVGFDKLELGPACFKHILLLGYSNGFQVVDVEDASNVCELVSKRDGPVTFLQMQPLPAKSEGNEGFRASHPLLLVVAGDESNGSGMVQGGRLSAFVRESTIEPQLGNSISTPTVVRFYSLKTHAYVHVLRFRSAVFMVRCSPRMIAVALAAQIYCFDAVTLENKFSVLTYPLQVSLGSNIGYGPMAVGPRWLAYSPNNPLLSNTGRLSPQNLTPSPGVSPSTSPGNGSLVARYAMESSKQLAAGILNLGDMGYKSFSKYCHELLPDGSNLSSNSGRRTGRHPSLAHPSESDSAGMVVVKDFVSKDTISQFRAHSSPISALCFDPSGTLLVTASVHGHNVNVFRIMPACIPNSSSSGRYDWTSSHVHLYKLYRGLTAAVIQDICFSNYSQWVAIVSSRGTCHVFVLSPFGGEVGLEPQDVHTNGPLLIPNLSPPWWSTLSCMMDQQFLPPPPVTLSVIGRIKNGNSGWINTVSNVAASAAGKMTIPSGAMTAVFHNCIYHQTVPHQTKANSLEHLLVYSPCGHVIQYELLPSLCVDSSDSSSRTSSGPLLQLQDEELHVSADPVQWWDVCRKSNWPEREEGISRIYDNRQNPESVTDTSDYDDHYLIDPMTSVDNMSRKEFVKSHVRHNQYLSNAEVLINSGRFPVWQKPKVCFYVMSPPDNGGSIANDYAGGEFEIEKLQVHEFEIRRKELLPVFEQFRNIKTDWTDRVFADGSHQPLSAVSTDTAVRHSDPASLTSAVNVGPRGSVELHSELVSDKSVQSSNMAMHSEQEDQNIDSVPALSQKKPLSRMTKYAEKDGSYFHSGLPNSNFPMDGCFFDGSYTSPSSLSYAGGAVIANTYPSSNSIGSEVLSACATTTETADSHNSVEFTQYFHEGYCKVSELDDSRDLTDAVTDVDSSSSHCEREKPDEDGDNDDMLGGVFLFSEEG